MATRIFTCGIFILSIIMMMMINNCHGSLSNHYANQCNGTITECHPLVEESEEFLMDTEEHRRLLVEQNVISLGALMADSNPFCSGKNNCAGLYDAKHRGCDKIYLCH
ncbi:putative rapid ALkalinization Factor [Helianthus annuus]|uniref:Rapid ALkalinization Factor n=1 Tax=Helianthus annuus TaxID=4232 RepID=A0A9K3DH48_HELAN|nr:putative rapid ALkalinization Factor [Helianthus annuus]KAJ0432900.1 putative rapid ALkalinization Factor [Helianthus annuus]KAJ0812672.1 putative rapid ALkalinization Factor [Helianthus annuus]